LDLALSALANHQRQQDPAIPLLRHLAQRGHRITLLVQSKVPLGDAAREALEPLLERLIVLPRRPLHSP
jgi:hypothetical protein